MVEAPAIKDRLVNTLQWATTRVRQRIDVRVGAIRRRFIKPPLPEGTGEVLLHLGCGEVDGKGFINIDARPLPHVHYLADVTDLSFVPGEYADLVYACHVFEHVPPESQRDVLTRWRRVLKPGGVLRISVPDFDRLIVLYEETGRDVRNVAGPLIGSMAGYLSHQALFNERYLSGALLEAGFRLVRPWDPATVTHHDFEDWASRRILRDGKEYPVSLNLEAVR